MADEEIAEVDVGSSGGKGLPSIVVIVIVAVVSLAIGFFASKALGGGKSSDAGNGAQQVNQGGEQDSGQQTDPQTRTDSGDVGQTDPAAEGDQSTASEGAEGSEQDKTEPGILVLDPFTVNLNDPFGRRYAQINMKLKITNKGMSARITGNELMMSEIRDEIFMVISSKSYNELKNTSGKITLKEEIRMRVNEIIKAQFDQEPVQKVFFEKFLIQ